MPSTSSFATEPAAVRATPQQVLELDRLEQLAVNLDSAFRIPGTRIRMGWDGLLGLIPGIGDVATLVPGAYIIYRAHAVGARPWTLTRMAANSGIDWLVGSIPVIGDIFDVGFKANRRNVALLRRHLERDGGARPRGSD